MLWGILERRGNRVSLLGGDPGQKKGQLFRQILTAREQPSSIVDGEKVLLDPFEPPLGNDRLTETIVIFHIVDSPAAQPQAAQWPRLCKLLPHGMVNSLLKNRVRLAVANHRD